MLSKYKSKNWASPLFARSGIKTLGVTWWLLILKMNWRTFKWLWTTPYKQRIKFEAYIYKGEVQVFDSFAAVWQGWKWKSLLTTRINELNLSSYLEEDLIIFDTIEEVIKECIHTSENYKLIKEIQSLSILKRERRRRYA